MISRRDLLKAGVAAGGSLLVIDRTGVPWAWAVDGALDTNERPEIRDASW